MSEARIWFYNDWDPEHWWERIVYFGGDEFDRRTLDMYGPVRGVPTRCLGACEWVWAESGPG